MLWADRGRWTCVSPKALETPGVEALPARRPGRALASLIAGRPYVHATVGDVLAAERARKDRVEQAIIAGNVACLGRALNRVTRCLVPGATELELWNALTDELHTTDDAVELAGNLAAGPRSLDPDPHATRRRFRAGEPVLLDAYPRIAGYHADLTRTWAIGSASPALEKVYGGVRAALLAVATRLRPRVSGGDLDRLARRELESRGLPGDFPHHTGHGFGVKQQEPPWLRPQSNDVIAVDSVIAVEPACYISGLGGVRLEQDFLVREDKTIELGPPITSFELLVR